MRLAKLFSMSLVFFILAGIGNPLAREMYYSSYNEADYVNFVDVPVIAVSSDFTTGVLGRVRIGLIKDGSGSVFFDERTSVDGTTFDSASRAVIFAESLSKKSGYDYFISYDLATSHVSGQSTGASVALGIYALLTNSTVKKDCVITGNIDENGMILEAGGVPVKVISAARLGVRNMFIPEGQGSFYNYRKVSDNRFYGSVVKLDDVALQYGMALSEAKSLEDVLLDLLG